MDNRYAFVVEDDGARYFGIIEDEKLVYYTNVDGLEGNIYRARIVKYVKALDAYIVDLGLDKNGLLRSRHAPKDFRNNDDILVEVYKESNNEKLHEVTAFYSITDGYLVLVRDLTYQKNYRLFLRTKGRELTEAGQMLKEEALRSRFELLIREETLLPSPKLLYKKNKLQDEIDKSSCRVLASREYDDVDGLEISEEGAFAIENYVAKALMELGQRTIVLANGIELIFEETEALTVVDINSKSFMLDESKKRLSFEVNKAVLPDLARLIYIKNIKKMLLIDFLRMAEASHYSHVEEAFKKELDKFKVKYQIYGFTKMGLFEMIIQ